MRSDTIRSDDEILAEIGADQDEPTGAALEAAPLREIAAGIVRRERAERDITQAVGRARAAGLSWAVIGAALGITRQGALKRYGDSPS